MGLAASYDQLGRFDFADRAYDQLLKVAGRRPEIVNNMGYSQLLRGNRKKSEQAAERGQGDDGRSGGRRRQSRAAQQGLSPAGLVGLLDRRDTRLQTFCSACKASWAACIRSHTAPATPPR